VKTSFGFFAALLFLHSFLQAAETGPLGGEMNFQTGVHDQGGPMAYFQVTRLLIDRKDELLPDLTLETGGEADWLANQNPVAIPWPEQGAPNLVNLEWNNFNSSDGVNYETLRLDRLNLQWAFDGAQATLGLQAWDWGSSVFYQPTRYFDPLSPLILARDEPQGSEGADLSCALLDDLSLEGAVRFLSGGTAEWVVRLPNRGIGFSATPSFAHLAGGDEIGLDACLTFPTFQVRLEGADYYFSTGGSSLETVTGLSTVIDQSALVLEWLDDGTGQAMGSYSNQIAAADYLFFSWQRTVGKNWKILPVLVKSLEGGPFLFWPKAVWNFADQWDFTLESQVRIAYSAGPLALNPDRLFMAVGCHF
jgi:hypothetical protein